MYNLAGAEIIRQDAMKTQTPNGLIIIEVSQVMP